MIFQITPENKKLLFQARFAIDGPFTDTQDLWKEVSNYAERTDWAAYVFIKDGEPVGYVELKLQEAYPPPNSPPLPVISPLGHIARIGVCEHERGNGIAGRLLFAAENWFITLHVPGVWLDYQVHNTPAARLYSDSGYQNVAEFADHKNPQNRRRIAIKQW